MKRILAMLLAVIMMVGLCACGSTDVPGSVSGGVSGGDEKDNEIFMLFDKYDEIIWALENQDYSYAIQEIVRLSNVGKELTSMDQIFQAEWYPEKDIDGDVPGKITVSEGGAVEIDGKAYTFLLENSNSESLWGWLMEEGTCRYQVNVSFQDGWASPRLTLYSARETADGYRSEDWLAEYYNDAMLPYLLMSWNRMGEDESMIGHFYIDYDDVQINSEELKWTVTAVEGQNLTADIDNGAYTAVLELRGEKPLLTLTENATGNSACYYSGLGYDRTWPEFIYPNAVEYLNQCLEDVENGWTPDFYDRTEEESVDYSGNAAWKRLYEMFTALGDYKDSAEIAARFTILKDMYTGATRTRVDNMGNENTDSSFETMKYNSLGQLIYGYNRELQWLYGGSNSGKYFEYDASGQITKIWEGYSDRMDMMITPTYDAQGRMVGGTYKNNSCTQELSYTYDAQGRLATSIVWSGGSRSAHTYTYDANGNLVKDVYWYGSNASNDYKGYRYTVDYTYDANGHLIKKVWTEEYYYNWDNRFEVEDQHIWVYTNDAQGRPVSADYTELYDGRSSYASQTITYNYDDLYFYNAN